MGIDEDLEGIDPIEVWEREARRIEGYAPELDDAAWEEPSRCAGWSRRDVVAHLAATEEYHRACLDGRVGALLADLAAQGADSVAAFNAIGIAGFAGTPVLDVLATFAREDAETRSRFRERGDGEVDSSVGAYPARWQAFHLAAEVATHADDLSVPVPPDEQAERTAWRRRFSRFALLEAERDLEIELGPTGTKVTGPDGFDVELDDEDFVEAVAGRGAGRVPDDVAARLSTVP